MGKLKFRNDEAALKRLSNAQSAIDNYSKSHKKMNKKEHAEFRKLLSNRASALSDATGMKIHSLFD